MTYFDFVCHYDLSPNPDTMPYNEYLHNIYAKRIWNMLSAKEVRKLTLDDMEYLIQEYKNQHREKANTLNDFYFWLNVKLYFLISEQEEQNNENNSR